MYRPFLIAGSLFGGLGVALGAFGAHGLQRITADEKIIHAFQTGVQYQVYHALALVALCLVFEKLPLRSVKWAGYCFITGILLFSGSLYLLTVLNIRESSLARIAGPVTPLGGLFLILGWIFLFAAAAGRKKG